MSSLIHIEQRDGELYADSRMVAQVLGVEHDSVSKIIRDKENTLGVSRFEIGKPSANGGRPEKYFLLTERQCLLLITMVRNSEEALKAKSGLVDAFLIMRKTLAGSVQAPRTMKEALRLALIQQELIEVLEAEKAVLAPKAAALDTIANAEGLTTVKEVAKRLGVGEKTFWDWLHTHGVLYRRNGHNLPFQKHIDAGRMTVKENAWEKDGKKHLHPQPFFTAKGLAWVSKIFVNGFELEAAS